MGRGGDFGIAKRPCSIGLIVCEHGRDGGRRAGPVAGRGFQLCRRFMSILMCLLGLAAATHERTVMAQGVLNGSQTSTGTGVGLWSKSWLSKLPFHKDVTTSNQIEMPCLNDAEIRPDGFLYSSYCNQFVPRRIVIVPAANRLDRLKEQDLFAQSLANSLVGHVEVVLSRHYACGESSPLRTGQYDEQALLDLSKEFSADAVLYCDVEKLSWQAPMRMQVSLLLIHVGEAIALVSGTESIDLSHSQPSMGYHGFAIPQSKNAILDMRQNSPRTFIRYCSTLVSDKLKKGLSR